jgi:hypothetical protein
VTIGGAALLPRFLYLGLFSVGSTHFESAGYLFPVNGKDELDRPELSFFDLEAAKVIAFIIHFPVKILASIVSDGKKGFSGHSGLNGEDEKIAFGSVEHHINGRRRGIGCYSGRQRLRLCGCISVRGNQQRADEEKVVEAF